MSLGKRFVVSGGVRTTVAWLLLLALSNSAFAQNGAEEAEERPFADGKEIFLHKWRKNDPKSHAGDGLGPLFNDVSCAACHHLGGIGGGGGNDKNVEILSVGSPPRDPSAFQRHGELLRKVHPQFDTQRHVPLHLSHVDDEYADWRLKRLGIRSIPKLDLTGAERIRKLVDKRRLVAGVVDVKVFDVPVRISYRNTPALFGAALINSIPDDAIREAAAVQSTNGVGISGRVPPAQRSVEVDQKKNNNPADFVQNLQKIIVPIMDVKLSAVGRFGWRGQTASLSEFVMGACANELGLDVPGHHQPRDPLKSDKSEVKLDLSQEQCNQLVAFVASIPRPQQIFPEEKSQIAQVERGEKVFEKILCANCHLKKLGNVDGLYSDLLLHDMGLELADPVPANTQDTISQMGAFVTSELPANMPVSIPQAVSSYLGAASSASMSESVNEFRREWRTPPLWGVRDSAPYLHDGRAQTLDDAIKLHGGEAKKSVDAFRKLGREDRECLFRFLNSLAAPQQD